MLVTMLVACGLGGTWLLGPDVSLALEDDSFGEEPTSLPMIVEAPARPGLRGRARANPERVEKASEVREPEGKPEAAGLLLGDHSGARVPGAWLRVRIEGCDAPLRIETDAYGLARLPTGVSADRVSHVYCEHASVFEGPYRPQPPDQWTDHRSVYARRKITLRGSVEDESGRPIENARVLVDQRWKPRMRLIGHEDETQTDNHGVWTAVAHTGRATVRIEASGYAPVACRLSVQHDDGLDWRLVLDDASEIRGWLRAPSVARETPLFVSLWKRKVGQRPSAERVGRQGPLGHGERFSFPMPGGQDLGDLELRVESESALVPVWSSAHARGRSHIARVNRIELDQETLATYSVVGELPTDARDPDNGLFLESWHGRTPIEFDVGSGRFRVDGVPAGRDDVRPTRFRVTLRGPEGRWLLTSELKGPCPRSWRSLEEVLEWRRRPPPRRTSRR